MLSNVAPPYVQPSPSTPTQFGASSPIVFVGEVRTRQFEV